MIGDIIEDCPRLLSSCFSSASIRTVSPSTGPLPRRSCFSVACRSHSLFQSASFWLLARLSKPSILSWPVTALVSFHAARVALLMLILWGYFLVPLDRGQAVPAFLTMLATLVVYQGAFLSEVVRGGIVAPGQGQMRSRTGTWP